MTLWVREKRGVRVLQSIHPCGGGSLFIDTIFLLPIHVYPSDSSQKAFLVPQ